MSEHPGAGPRWRRRGVRSFVFGGVVGGAIAVVAPRLRRGRDLQPGQDPVVGLEAFEGAPCWEHDHGRTPRDD